MGNQETKDIERLLDDEEIVTRALREGVVQALRRHVSLGLPVVVWRDGGAVRVPPQEIVLPPDSAGDGSWMNEPG
ncbi:MAG: hypothetical protein ACKVU1_07275 [bacterium]